MTPIEIPTHREREYLRAFGVVAVYVAAGNERGPCLIGYTRDLGRTLESIRARWHWSIVMPAAWWMAEQSTAVTVITRINEGLPLDARGLFDIEADKLAQRIDLLSPLGLTRHADAMVRVRAAAARVDAVIETANRSGELAWFNTGYRDWRTGEGSALAPAVSYGRARASLRAAVVRRIAAGAAAPVGSDLMREVFPALAPEIPAAGALAGASGGADSPADPNRAGDPENGFERVRTKADATGRYRTINGQNGARLLPARGLDNLSFRGFPSRVQARRSL